MSRRAQASPTPATSVVGNWRSLALLTPAERSQLREGAKWFSFDPSDAIADRQLALLRAQTVVSAGCTAGEVELEHRGEAVRFYGAYLITARPETAAARHLAIKLCSLCAQLYRYDLNNPSGALAVLDWGYARYHGADGTERLVLERDDLIRGQLGLAGVTPEVERAFPARMAPLNLPAPVSPVGEGEGGGEGAPRAVPVAPVLTAKAAAPAPLALGVKPVVANVADIAPAVARQLDQVAAVAPVIPAKGAAPAPSALGVKPVAPPPSGATAGGMGVSPVFGAPIPAAPAASVPPVSPPPSGDGHGGQLQPAALPSAVAFGDIKDSAMWEELKSGKLTPDEAWAKGDLTYDKIVDFFEHHTGEWIVSERRDDGGWHEALVQSLIEHAPAKLVPINAVPARTRLWLADYWAETGDARAVGAAQSIIDTYHAPVTTESNQLFQAIERLAWYYRGLGRYEQAAQSYLIAPKLFDRTSWTVPDALVEAARLYLKAGKEQTARALYGQVAQYGNGWSSGMALCDQASELMAQGQQAQARQLLLTPLRGQYADRAEVVLWSQAALSFYQSADLTQARQYGGKAIAQAQEVDAWHQNQEVQDQVARARQLVVWCDQWSKAPLVCLPGVIEVTLTPEELSDALKNGHSAVRRFVVRSMGALPVESSCDNRGIKVSAGVAGAGDYYQQRSMALLLSPELIHQAAAATGPKEAPLMALMTLSSQQQPHFSLRVPVQIRLQTGTAKVKTASGGALSAAAADTQAGGAAVVAQ